MPHTGEPIIGRLGLLDVIWGLRNAERAHDQLVATLQAARLRDLVAFVRARSPFYSQRYRLVPPDVIDLRRFPPVSKPELMAGFDDWVTDRSLTLEKVRAFVADHERVGDLFQGRYAVWTTSGTTGEPGIFVHDADALRVYGSLALWRCTVAWVKPSQVRAFLQRGVRVAVVICTGGHYAGTAITELARRIRPSLARRVRAFSVLAPMAETVVGMNEFQPTILVGYPTAMTLLAQQRSSGKLRISPTLIVTAAETLTPADREQLAGAFGCQVGNCYAASEFMGIAFSCDQGQLHANADWVILEPVDERYEPVPRGQPSYTVLLTNLINRVQPIIRYDLGDSIALDPLPCACGSNLPVIRLCGRRDDILHLLAPSGETVPILPMALAAVVEEEPRVRRYQLVQTAPAVIAIRIDATPGSSAQEVQEAVARRLGAYLTEQGLPSVQVERSSEPPERDPVSSKFRQVWAALEGKEDDHAKR